jgi:hypothetical protein
MPHVSALLKLMSCKALNPNLKGRVSRRYVDKVGAVELA